MTTTTNAVALELQPRELLGKKVGRLRRRGVIPVHLYGPGMDSRALQCPAPQLVQALTRAGGSTPIAVTIAGESGSHLAFVREIQWQPRRDTIIHVDFLAANVARPVTAQVNLVFVGESEGARNSGGQVSQQLFAVEVQALPLEMPAQIEVDLAQLAEADQVIRVGDLAAPPAASITTDAEEIVARVDVPRGAVGQAGDADGP